MGVQPAQQTQTITPSTSIYMPAMTIVEAMARRKYLVEFTKTQGLFEEGTHFGKIPGTDKPTLLKPGAEMLLTFFGLNAKPKLVESVLDWTGKSTSGEPFFSFSYRYNIYRGEQLIASADGSCNSMESKYRYRWVGIHDVPPGMDTTNLKKNEGSVIEFGFSIDKAESTGKYGKPAAYWEMWREAIRTGKATKTKKKTQAGKEFDAWQMTSVVVRVPNPDIADQVNTIMQMAQKRALVAATRIAVNASEFFTQDLEDFANGEIIEGSFKDATPPEPPSGFGDYGHQAAAQKPQNGKTQTELQIAVSAWQDAKARALKIGGLDETISKFKPASDCKDPQIISNAAAALQAACDAISPPVN